MGVIVSVKNEPEGKMLVEKWTITATVMVEKGDHALLNTEGSREGRGNFPLLLVY